VNHEVTMPRHDAPWHERLALTRAVRGAARAGFFRILRAALATDDGRAILNEALVDRLSLAPLPAAESIFIDAPYADLGSVPAERDVAAPGPVFITARFRTGSTLLWNIFRHIEGCTAYYEPLNERRWFDPGYRGSRVDQTHRQVDDYWREYDGLTQLARYYKEDWIRRRLHMSERAWDPDLAAYVRTMVEAAPGRAVLQFNRIDFRLAWFRRAFPTATIVHIYRHPRDQWCSTFPDPDEYPSTASPQDFAAHDHYYLQSWAADLQQWFPFLGEHETSHPYQTFYYIWKLSYWWGRTYAHHSLSFERLVANPARELERLFRIVGVAAADVSASAALIAPTPTRWTRYADDRWFRAHEVRCERVLQDFFRTMPGRATEIDRDIAGAGRSAVDVSR
jgi:hypothetical protein